MVGPLPEGYLDSVDLNTRNAAIFEDFLQFAGIEAAERAFLFGVFR